MQPIQPPLTCDVRTMIDALACQHIWSRFASFHSPVPMERLRLVPVTFDLSSDRIAGQYKGAERRIRLNIALRAPDVAEHLRATFLHELAHAADHVLNGRADNHNANWCALMGQLGQKPEIYHTLNLRRATSRLVNPSDLGL